MAKNKDTRTLRETNPQQVPPERSSFPGTGNEELVTVNPNEGVFVELMPPRHLNISQLRQAQRKVILFYLVECSGSFELTSYNYNVLGAKGLSPEVINELVDYMLGEGTLRLEAKPCGVRVYLVEPVKGE